MAMAKITNGASLRPSSGNTPKHIILLLHGFGSNGTDMIGLASHWQPMFPDALFLAPHAPQPCAMAAGYQWWDLTNFTPASLAAGAASAAPAIHSFIDRKLAQYGLKERDLALVGFSQGTMMALHVGLRRQKPAAIVGYSGMLTSTDDIGASDLAKPPILLIHGSADPVVPVGALPMAQQELQSRGIQVDTHIAQGLGHSVDAEGLKLGSDFLEKALR